MKSHLSYWKYILRHKWFVYVAGRKTKAPLWRLIIHDWSKFLPCEWFPYLRYFHGVRTKYPYGSEMRNKIEAEFDEAWLHHIHHNPHHWQHWVLREDSGSVKCLQMPDHFVREMVADWAGAGRGITGKWDVEKWYEENKNKMHLHPGTRYRVECLLHDHFGYRPTCNLIRGEWYG